MRSFAKLTILALALGLASPALAASNIVTNGTFSSGLSGWTVAPGTEIGAGDGNLYSGCCNTGALASQSDTFAAFGGGNVPNVSTLSQALLTIPGQDYTLTFDLTALGGGTQGFSASLFDGSTLLGSLLSTASAGSPFSTYSFNFFATSASTNLVFNVNPLGSGEGDGVDAILDNVSVSAAPEPATWAMMILGFGIVGASLRRRRTAPLAHA
jgi:hypothetical protein